MQLVIQHVFGLIDDYMEPSLPSVVDRLERRQIVIIDHFN